MDLNNKNITDKSNSFTKGFKEKVKQRVSDKFDISIIGKINLAEAEEIAKEEILFLTENDIIEGLEDFELVTTKSIENLKNKIPQEIKEPHDSADDIKINDEEPKVEPVTEIAEIRIIDDILDTELKTSDIDKTSEENFTEISDDSANKLHADDLEGSLDQIGESSVEAEKVAYSDSSDGIMIEWGDDIDGIEISLDGKEEILSKDVYSDIPVDPDVKIDDIEVLFDEKEEIPSGGKIHSKKIDVEADFDKAEKKGTSQSDSDFDFFAGALTRGDDKKHVYESDDSSIPEKIHLEGETSEILGLESEENNYINDKLFGDYNTLESKQVSDISRDALHVPAAGSEPIDDTIISRDALLHAPVISSDLIDITNDIIILDDKEKLIELTSEFPEKRDHLVKLLSYLDGLFEKLPEDVIRKFAESEYFDLYSKILKDMGM